MSFSRFPRQVARDPLFCGLTRVLAALGGCSDAHGNATVRIATLATHTGLSGKTVKKWVAVLEAEGYLTKAARRGAHGRRLTNHYAITYMEIDHGTRLGGDIDEGEQHNNVTRQEGAVDHSTSIGCPDHVTPHGGANSSAYSSSSSPFDSSSPLVPPSAGAAPRRTGGFLNEGEGENIPEEFDPMLSSSAWREENRAYAERREAEHYEDAERKEAGLKEFERQQKERTTLRALKNGVPAYLRQIGLAEADVPTFRDAVSLENGGREILRFMNANQPNDAFDLASTIVANHRRNNSSPQPDVRKDTG